MSKPEKLVRTVIAASKSYYFRDYRMTHPIIFYHVRQVGSFQHPFLVEFNRALEFDIIQTFSAE